MKSIGITLFFCLVIFKAFGQEEKKQLKALSIAFYNLENLFDTIDDPKTWDESFTPEGDYNWTIEKLNTKIENLALVISKIGTPSLDKAPSIIGIAEVENKEVLEKLVNHPSLQVYDYGIVHFNSPDRRGIDVGFLYRRNQFNFLNAQKHFLALKSSKDEPIWTRDQLCVSGTIDNELIYFIVNHWPSRRGGAKRSEAKRIKAAELTQKISDSIFRLNKNANIIIMGDFNDNPTDRAFKKILKTKKAIVHKENHYFFNPFETKFKKGLGSLGFRDKWYLFDQMILSSSLTDTIGWKYLKASIYNPPFLQNKKGKYKGYPKRSSGSKFGYSDHFPIYVLLGKTSKP